MHVLHAQILSIFILLLASCSGEAGNYNTDGSLPDGDTDNIECPQENVCGMECCSENQECVNGTYCDEICETERCRGICCGDGEECVNEMECLPVCDTVRCGDNLRICCNDGEICLDGVQCASDCAQDEALCGENLDICCNSGEVCLRNECVIPGSNCTDNFDCPDDTWYCEEYLGKCLPLGDEEICQGEAEFNEIQPVLEWYWPGVTYGSSNYRWIIAAPAVGDVNGDGIPDIVVPAYANTAISDTLLVVLDGRGDGAGNGLVLFTIPSADDPSAPRPYAQATVALANFDDDPGLEIVYNTIGGGLRIADNDGIGTVCDSVQYPGCTGERHSGYSNVVVEGGPVVTDFDHDGMPDVVLRCHAMNGRNISDAALDFANVSGCAVDTVVADLNLDGNYEMIDGNHAITVDPATPGGSNMWDGTTAVTAGYVAVADLFPDTPAPEVINIRTVVTIRDGITGEILVGAGGSIVNQAIPIPGSGLGGAPTVADFDGDGLPEFSTAGTAAYVVYDPDCWEPALRAGGLCASNRTDFILWSTATQDISSSRTGSSVFDFQGDGPAEVLYNDECFLHIFDGTDGSEVVQPVIPSSSRTGSEYPLVADVDGDGNAEMVVISNGDQAISRDHCDVSWKAAEVDINYLCEFTTCTSGAACPDGVTCPDGYMCDSSLVCQRPGGFTGIRIFGDAYDRWVRTRPVWNQFSYHVTNFEKDFGFWSVPDWEYPNWTDYNNYRQNVQGGVLFPVPDLTAELTSTPICPDEVRLLATVRNAGSAGAAPGINVDFYRTDVDPPEFIERITTQTTILTGGFERILAVYTGVQNDVDMTFSVVIDNDEIVEECMTSNNIADSETVRCVGIE